MSSYGRQQLEAWLKTIDVKAESVLDVGGSLLPVKGRTKSWDVEDYKILDLKAPHECKQKPDYKIDIEEFRIPFVSLFQKFDIAFCLEVSEYWFNPYLALLNIFSYLKPGGIFYISTHFIYPVHAPIEDDCLRYTRAGIIKLLEKTGFEIESITTRTIVDCDVMGFYRSQKMHPAKTYSRHDEVGHLIKARKI